TQTKIYYLLSSIFNLIRYIQLFGPVKAVGWGEGPGGAVVLDVGEHGVERGWRSRLLQHQVAPQIHDRGHLVYVYGARLGAGVAGGAGPQLFGRNVAA